MNRLFKHYCFFLLWAFNSLCGLQQQDFSSVRNPFKCTHQKQQISNQATIVLEGIVHTDNNTCAAVLRCANVRSIICLGEKFMNYTVEMIEKKFVVLASDQDRLTLSLE